MAEGFLLPHPWEPLLLHHGQAISFRVSQWLLGEIEIQPKGATEKMTIPVLRVYPYDASKAPKAPWYDLTYTQLQGALLPYLENIPTSSSRFTLRANAYGVRKNFTIEVNP